MKAELMTINDHNKESKENMTEPFPSTHNILQGINSSGTIFSKTSNAIPCNLSILDNKLERIKMSPIITSSQEEIRHVHQV